MDVTLLAVGVAAFTGIELKFDPIKRLQKHHTDLFGRWVKPYSLWSAAFCFTGWLSLLMFADFSQNILTMRLFDQGHWLTWLVIVAVMTRYGWDDVASGVAIAALFGAANEIFWYVGYLLVFPPQTLGFGSVTYSLFLLVVVFAYYALMRNGSVKKVPGQKLLLFLGLSLSVHVLWALAGYPVSLGSTPDDSLATALIEGLSWVIPGMALL
jgi:hypothetical protein